MKTLKYFYKNDCIESGRTKPGMIKMSELGFNVTPINLDDDKSLYTTYKIERTPTYIIEQDGKEIQRWVGDSNTGIIMEELRK